jgi:UPF0716 protein FxsA
VVTVRRRIPWGVLAVLFVVVPLIELYVLIQVGQVIGAWETVLLVVAVGILGAYLIKREGRRAWQALRVSLETHKMPARELADGALILIGGTLLLTPGLLSDVVGLFFIVPFTRPFARRLLSDFVARKLLGGPLPRTRQRPGHDSVIQGEVVD